MKGTVVDDAIRVWRLRSTRPPAPGRFADVLVTTLRDARVMASE